MDQNLPEDELPLAIVRVLSGDLPEREEIELRQWLDADPERRKLFQEMRLLWDEAGAGDERWNTTPLQQRIIAARRQKARRHSPTFTRVQEQRRVRPSHLALAASIMLIVGVSGWFAARRVDEAKVAAVPIKEITTKRGQRATVQLPDGSRITLGAASTLRYADRIDTASKREVGLTGDAYFEVAHNAKRPFVVRTALGVARDLGTKFLVRAHDRDYVDIVVVEGLVSLKSAPAKPDSLLLQPADLGRLDAAGNLGVEHNTELTAVLAWTQGQLVFKNASVVEVAGEIERSYDVTLRIGDPLLRDVRFSGSFGAEPASDVVTSFAKSIGATAEKENGGFVLVRRGER